MSPLHWRTLCEVEGCDWTRGPAASRDEAIRFGRWHVEQSHRDDEYEFRVQGIATGRDALNEPVTTQRGTFPPHRWQPKIGSRNKALPCGICGLYRWVHADIYRTPEPPLIASVSGTEETT